MILQILNEEFSVCRLTKLPETLPEFCFFARTEEELSLVCHTDAVPQGIEKREDGWRALRVAGELDFSLVGILSGIAGTLARAGIPIFAVSTYNTDYILVKDIQGAKEALREAYYRIEDCR